MPEIMTVEFDVEQNVFQVHGADGAGRSGLRENLRRAQVLEVFNRIPRCVVTTEPCGAVIIGAVRLASWVMMCG